MITPEQLNELSQMLRPALSQILGEPLADIQVAITLRPTNGDTDEAAMRFEIRIRGQEVTPEQEALVADMIQDYAPGKTIAKH